MIAILSPSKTMDFETAPRTKKFTLPRHLDQTEKLATKMKKLSAKQIAKMMHISDKLAELNYQRYQDFHTPFTPKNAKQAILAFKGDVYRDIDIDHYSEDDFAFAQKSLRSLSGLYGLLRPLDLIQPYRMEMKYQTNFWKGKITETLNEDLENEKILINLASNEYSKPVDFKKINGRVINVAFKEKRDGKLKTVALYSKIARGTMANYMVKNRVTDPEKLKDFRDDGYKFEKSESSENSFIFIRD